MHDCGTLCRVPDGGRQGWQVGQSGDDMAWISLTITHTAALAHFSPRELSCLIFFR